MTIGITTCSWEQTKVTLHLRCRHMTFWHRTKPPQPSPCLQTFLTIPNLLPRWLSSTRICLPMQETVVWPLGWEDPLEEEMSTHSSNFALKIPRTEEPRGLQFIGLQRIGHNWATKHACTQLTNNFKSMPLPNIMPPLSNVKDYLTLSPQNTQSPFVHLLMTPTLLAKSTSPLLPYYFTEI